MIGDKEEFRLNSGDFLPQSLYAKETSISLFTSTNIVVYMPLEPIIRIQKVISCLDYFDANPYLKVSSII